MLDEQVYLESPTDKSSSASLDEKIAKRNARNLAYSKSPRGRETRLAYCRRPEVKEKRNASVREWRKTPAGQEWMKRWNSDPVVKDKKSSSGKTTRAKKAQAEFRARVRAGVLEAYGGEFPRCACCGEERTEFLAVDHINGGGVKHLKEINGNLYLWLRKNNYPRGFRLLCHNCNFSLGAYGHCPHNNLEAK